MQQPNKIVRIDRRARIRLTAEDRRVAPMTRASKIVDDMTATEPPMPALNNYPELYHACDIHGLYEPRYVALLQRWIKRACPCVEQERIERERAERVEDWTRWQVANCYGGWLGSDFKDTRIADKMAEKTLESFYATPGDENVRIAQEFAYAERPKGNILFCGSYGTGKTHLGSAILNFRRSHWRNTTLFASASQLFAALEEARRLHDQTQYISVRQRMVQSDIFYLDDVDKEWRGEWKQPELHSIYYYILDERYKARRPTIVSTNELDRLEAFIGAAAKSRLMSRCKVLNMVGEDFRSEEEW